MKGKNQYHVVGMNHIDLGFVKRKEEQAELLEILLERVVSLLERYPQLHYAIEQAYHYRDLEKRRPDLFAKVKDLIAQGRIEMMGAMVSSLDTNFTNGESFVRNQALGLRWTKEYLNTVPKAAWLEDTFGINAQVPQILNQFGFRYLFANRFGGKNPYDIFCDCGIDGSEIIVLGRDLECRQIFPNSQAFVFCKGWNDIDRLFADADQLTGDLPKLVVYYLENQEVLGTYCLDLIDKRNQRDGEEWLVSSYGEYLKAIEGKTDHLIKLYGDLNPEFTGTFALRTPIKIKNRQAENALLEAEQWNALLNKKNSETLDNFWWDLGYVQFHDVFSGSHGDCTYIDVINILENVKKGSYKKTWSLFQAQNKEDSILCLNGLPMVRNEWIEVPNSQKKTMQIYQGQKQLPVVYHEGKTYCKPELSPVSITELSVSYGDIVSENCQKGWTDCDRCVLENQYVHMSFDKNLGIEQLSLADGTVVMQNVREFLVVQHDKGQFQIDDFIGDDLFVMDETTHLSYQENAMEQKAVLSGTFQSMPWNRGENVLEWQMEFTLQENSSAITIHLTFDWVGEESRIRLKFPNTVNSSKGIYEIPFGVVERSAYSGHPTAKGEWPAHRFVAVEDQDKGFALINQGVAGVELVGSTLETTLLRAYPSTPDVWVPVTPLSSQHGHHEYDFQLVVYQPKKRIEVVQMAQKFNRPVLVSSAHKSVECGSFIQIDAPNIVLSGVKNTDDRTGDLIIRYYETNGEDTQAAIYIRNATEVYLSDVTESKRSLLVCDNQTVHVECKPFEIQTLRIAR